MPVICNNAIIAALAYCGKIMNIFQLIYYKKRLYGRKFNTKTIYTAEIRSFAISAV